MSQAQKSDDFHNCTQCDQSYRSNGELLKHLYRAHPHFKPNQCEFCSKSFLSICNYRRHLLTHTKEKPYQCHLCTVRFTERGNLVRHINKIHENKNVHKISCPFCHKICSEPSSLETHLTTHTRERPFFCKLCQFECCRKSVLQEHHIRKHNSNGETKKFKCELCESKFWTCSQLTNHLQNHLTVERPYLCQKCGKNFKSKYKLQRHEALHSKRRVEDCKICLMKVLKKPKFGKQALKKYCHHDNAKIEHSSQ